MCFGGGKKSTRRRSLVELLLSNCVIGEECAGLLFHALPSSGRLDSLVLKRSDVGAKGAAALAACIVECKELSKLSVVECGVTVEDAKCILEALPMCERLMSCEDSTPYHRSL